MKRSLTATAGTENRPMSNMVTGVVGRTARVAIALTVVAVFAVACTPMTDTILTSSTVDKRPVKMVQVVTQTQTSYGYSSDDSARVVKVSAPRTFHGSAPYICSPSGFGQKSRCFMRQSVL